MSVARATLLALLLGLLLAAPAGAVPILDDADATELAATLAKARAAQGVCYGWVVDVEDQSGVEGGQDLGADTGAGEAVDTNCPKWVELQGSVTYTCESCESEDSAGIRVESNFGGAPTDADLEGLGLVADDLTGDNGDVVLTNMVGALPLITASNGAAAPVPVATGADVDEPAPGDAPTGAPSTPDWLRESGAVIVFLGLLIGGGVYLLIRDRRAKRTGASARPTP